MKPKCFLSRLINLSKHIYGSNDLKLVRRQNLEDKQRELEFRRKELEMKIAALHAEVETVKGKQQQISLYAKLRADTLDSERKNISRIRKTEVS